MKHTLLIISIFWTLNLFGQKLTEEVGNIEVQLIGHHLKYDDDLVRRKGKTNRKNRPYRKLFFDSEGFLLKSISFGTLHNADLRLVNSNSLYKYVAKKLTESIEYFSDNNKSAYPYFKTIYTYNDIGQLIDESTVYYNTDSLFFRTSCEYDSNSNKVKSIFNPTYYYQREFDSFNRIVVLRQVYNNKLRWDYKYSYSDNVRLGIFQTYYNDGKDYSKKETQTYNKKGLLIEIEEEHVSKDGLDKKTKYFYDECGVISKVEKYESYSFEKDYRLVWYSEIVINIQTKIDSEMAERINEQINIE